MIVMINGSFGAGKTTIAKALRRMLPGSAIYDPEWAGIGLMRLPKWIKLKGSGADDFQHMDLWRKTAVWGTRLLHFFVSGPVLMPMTFTHRPYFDEIVLSLRQADPKLRVFCLRASLPTINKRLEERGTKITGNQVEWITRRNLECVEAHRDDHFGEPIDTDERSASEVAEEIFKRLQPATTTSVQMDNRASWRL